MTSLSCLSVQFGKHFFAPCSSSSLLMCVEILSVKWPAAEFVFFFSNFCNFSSRLWISMQTEFWFGIMLHVNVIFHVNTLGRGKLAISVTGTEIIWSVTYCRVRSSVPKTEWRSSDWVSDPTCDVMAWRSAFAMDFSRSSISVSKFVCSNMALALARFRTAEHRAKSSSVLQWARATSALVQREEFDLELWVLIENTTLRCGVEGWHLDKDCFRTPYPRRTACALDKTVFAIKVCTAASCSLSFVLTRYR